MQGCERLEFRLFCLFRWGLQWEWRSLSQSRKHMEQICRLARPYSATSQRKKHARTHSSWLQGFHPLHLIFQLLVILKSTIGISTLSVSTYTQDVFPPCTEKSIKIPASGTIKKNDDDDDNEKNPVVQENRHFLDNFIFKVPSGSKVTWLMVVCN